MTKWCVEFDTDDGMWLRSSLTTYALAKAGYAAGAFRNEKTGVKTYTLHRMENGLYPIVLETESLDQLNAYINQKLAENRIGCYHSTNKVPDCYPPSMKDVASVTP